MYLLLLLVPFTISYKFYHLFRFILYVPKKSKVGLQFTRALGGQLLFHAMYFCLTMFLFNWRHFYYVNAVGGAQRIFG